MANARDYLSSSCPLGVYGDYPNRKSSLNFEPTHADFRLIISHQQTNRSTPAFQYSLAISNRIELPSRGQFMLKHPSVTTSVIALV